MESCILDFIFPLENTIENVSNNSQHKTCVFGHNFILINRQPIPLSNYSSGPNHKMKMY